MHLLCFDFVRSAGVFSGFLTARPEGVSRCRVSPELLVSHNIELGKGMSRMFLYQEILLSAGWVSGTVP